MRAILAFTWLTLCINIPFNVCKCIFLIKSENEMVSNSPCTQHFHLRIPFSRGSNSVIELLTISNHPATPPPNSSPSETQEYLQSTGRQLIFLAAEQFCSLQMPLVPTSVCAEVANELAWRELLTGPYKITTSADKDYKQTFVNVNVNVNIKDGNSNSNSNSVDIHKDLAIARKLLQDAISNKRQGHLHVAIVSYTNPILLEMLLNDTHSNSNSNNNSVVTTFHLFDESCQPSSSIQALQKKYKPDSRLVLKCGDISTTMLIEVGNPLMLKNSLFELSIVDTAGFQKTYDDDVTMLTRLSATSRIGSKLFLVDCKSGFHRSLVWKHLNVLLIDKEEDAVGSGDDCIGTFRQTSLVVPLG